MSDTVPMRAPDVMRLAGLAKSGAEAKRLICQMSPTLDGVSFGMTEVINVSPHSILRCGNTEIPLHAILSGDRAVAASPHHSAWMKRN